MTLTQKGKTPPAKTPKKDSRLVGGSETILVVDDEAIILEVLQEMLGRFGYNILQAESGEQALEIFRDMRERIDLVILDLGMPGMGGHQCLKELLKIDSKVKVIVASGYSASLKVRDTLESGAADFIPKPYRHQDILEKIRNVIDRKG